MSDDPSLPPLKECSSDDVASYKALVEALRSSSRENKTIEGKALAKFVSDIRRFQDKFLGKDAMDKPYWPMVRLPDALFRDRSSGGPLFTILSSAYGHIRERASSSSSSVATFEWESSEKYDENITMLKQIEADLIARNMLDRPAIYWDETVSDDVRAELELIVTRFGGTIVEDAEDATHVIAHDEEVDSEEARNEEKRNNDEGIYEKQYLRTLVVLAETHPQPALVHWWFWPSSSDEWMPALDVAGVAEDPPSGPKGGPFVMACRFVRDIVRFNEWGVEADYSIEDYQEKVSLYKDITTKSAKKSNKKPKARSKKTEELISPEPTETSLPTNDSPVFMENLVSSPTRLSASGTKRDRKPGMDPRHIMTGFYGARGERIRHMVHDGALRMAPEAVEVLDGAMQSAGHWGKGELSGDDDAAISQEGYELPGLDYVTRPSKDKLLGSITVTELSLRQCVPVLVPAETEAVKTIATNRRYRLKTINDEPQRIRGGGEGDLQPIPMDIDKPEVSTTIPSAVTNQPAVVSTNPPAVSQSSTVAVLPPVSNPPTPSIVIANKQVSSVAVPVAVSQPIAPPTQPLVLQQKPVPIDTRASATPTQSLLAEKSTILVSGVASQPAPKPSVPVSSSIPAAAPKFAEAPIPTVIASSAKVPTPAPTVSTNKHVVLPLPKRPASHWEQHVPGANDDVPQEVKTPKPLWYDPKKSSDFEQQMLPEWFDESATHRTLVSYMDSRERIIQMSEKMGNRYLTATMVRRSVPGDVGSLLRMHNFLVAWGFINEEAINDSAPTCRGLRDGLGATWRATEGPIKRLGGFWTDSRRDKLLETVVEQSSKRQKLGEGSSVDSSPATASPAFAPINWDNIAELVGSGASSVECEREFLSLQLDVPLDESATSSVPRAEPSVTSDNRNDVKGPAETNKSELKRELKEEILRDLVDGARPEVVKAATEAALGAAENLSEGQQASVLGIVGSQAMACAKKEEESISRVLAELVDQRMSKVENRLALMDDVEGMLEAERVALELERRDLYTTRCRHWFGGGH